MRVFGVVEYWSGGTVLIADFGFWIADLEW